MVIKIRPVSSAPVVADGTYPGKIVSVDFKSEPNKFNNNEPQEVIYTEVSIKTPEGPVKLRKRVTYVESWSEKSNMFKVLSDLDCLPEPGEGFDFNDLLGMNVTVAVKNNTQDGKTYVNIDQMLPRVAKREVHTRERKIQKVEKKLEDDSDFDFGDIIDEVGDDGDSSGDDDVENEDED